MFILIIDITLYNLIHNCKIDNSVCFATSYTLSSSGSAPRVSSTITKLFLVQFAESYNSRMSGHILNRKALHIN